jgi:hypothetical protein
MLVSDVHYIELATLKDYEERLEILTFLNRYGKKTTYNTLAMRERTKEIRLSNISIADVFITTDDELLKKSKRIGKILTLNPIEFCNQENLL